MKWISETVSKITGTMRRLAGTAPKREAKPLALHKLSISATGEALIYFRGTPLATSEVFGAYEAEMIAGFKASPEFAAAGIADKRVADAEHNVNEAITAYKNAKARAAEFTPDDDLSAHNLFEEESRRQELEQLKRDRETLRKQAQDCRHAATLAWDALVFAAKAQIGDEARVEYEAAKAELLAAVAPLLDRLQLATIRKMPHFQSAETVLGRQPEAAPIESQPESAPMYSTGPRPRPEPAQKTNPNNLHRLPRVENLEAVNN